MKPIEHKNGNDSKAAPIWKSRLFLTARIAVAVVLVVVIFSVIDFNSVGSILAGADMRWIIVILALALLDRYLMAYKWAVLLRSQDVAFSDWEAFKVYMSSTFVGTILPTSVGGDVYRGVRTTLGGTQTKVITASIVLERVLGMLAVTLLSLTGLGILTLQNESLRSLFIGVLAFAIVLLIAVRLTIHPTAYTLLCRVMGRFSHVKPVRILLSLHNAYTEFGRHHKVLGGFFALSVLEQAVTSVLTFMGAMALGLGTPLLYFLALVPLSRFITLMPISIGGIGVTEGAYVFVFAIAGMSAENALSLAVLMRIIGWVILIPAGFVFMLDSIKFKRQRRAATK